MPALSLQDRITNVERNLDRAIELLLHMGPGIGECPAILGETAESLTAIKREWPPTQSDWALHHWQLRRIHEKNSLAQQLLNSATSFYCGWLSAGFADTGGYSAEMNGSVASASAFRMEA